MSTPTPLNRLLDQLVGGHAHRVLAKHLRSAPNSYCQVDELSNHEVVIDGRRLLNFNAINYLGLESDPRMISAAQDALAKWGTLAGSARAAAELGLFEQLEGRIAKRLGVDNVLVYTTVTLANHGIIPLLMRAGSLILMDVEVHNSVQRAAIEAKGAGAALMQFKHDDFEQLERILAANRSKHDHVMIALDGVYSMLGTYLDLPRYEELARKYDAYLYIDDAHGFGVVGPQGRGIVSHYNGNYDNTIYVGSLEKGLASLGGFAVLPAYFRDFLRFHSYTYIFSGQLPPPYLASALKALDILEEEGEARLSRLRELISYVKEEVAALGFEIIASDEPFPLILVKVGGVYSVPAVSQFFFDRGIHILTVGFPVVPLDRGAMVRISLSATHTYEQVDRMLDVFRELRDSRVAAASAVAVNHASVASPSGQVAS